MTSVQVPTQDLVPSVTSRVVTIDVTDMQEGAPAEGWIDFILPCDLHVAADDKIIKAGAVRVTLDQGKGQVRLPTYDPDAKREDGSDDWGIIVRKSWTSGACKWHRGGCGCAGGYLVRVPVGTSAVSLADLAPVRPLRGREKQYAITGVSVSVTEGTASGSATLSGGILNLALSYPRADWKRGSAANGIDWNTVRGWAQSGIWSIDNSAAAASMLNLPIPFAGEMEVKSTVGGYTTQTFSNWGTAANVWVRHSSGAGPGDAASNWTAWRSIAWQEYVRGVLPNGQNIDQMVMPVTAGLWSPSARNTYSGALPPDWGPGDFESLAAGTGAASQRFTPYAKPYSWERTCTSYINYTWTAWRKTGALDSDTITARLDSLESGSPDPARLIAPAVSNADRIVMWGDSLTHAGGIATRLGELLPAVEVVNAGISGQTAGQIAARQGGRPALITIAGGSIPASGPVAVASRSEAFLAQTGYPARTETGTLAGVHGTMSVEAGQVAYTFTRTTDGDVVPVPAGTPFITDSGKAARADTQIIWAGRNNPETGVFSPDLSMAAHLTPGVKRFLVLSVTNSPDETAGTAKYNTIMSQNRQLEAFEGQYLNIRRWLIDEGLAAAGITPTAEDDAAVAGDAVPPSLTTDGVHFTATAQRLIAEQINARMTALGWY